MPRGTTGDVVTIKGRESIIVRHRRRPDQFCPDVSGASPTRPTIRLIFFGGSVENCD